MENIYEHIHTQVYLYAHILCVYMYIHIQRKCTYVYSHTEKEKETERQKVTERELNDKKFMSVDHFHHINFNTTLHMLQ